MSTPAAACLPTISATAAAMRACKASRSTGTPSSFANIMRTRSAGRGRLPVCVVRKRSLLRFMIDSSSGAPGNGARRDWLDDRMNRLSLAPVTINEVDPPALIEAAQEAGFASTDLRVLGAPGAAPVAPVIGNRPMIAAIAAALANTGVTLFSATGIWLVPEFELDAALPALEVAA